MHMANEMAKPLANLTKDGTSISYFHKLIVITEITSEGIKILKRCFLFNFAIPAKDKKKPKCKPQHLQHKGKE
jgi:hypothetical protein